MSLAIGREAIGRLGFVIDLKAWGLVLVEGAV